jgi:hypothetical protein
MEIYFACTPIVAQMQCPKCRAGYMMATGKQIHADPVSYQHVCSNQLCLHPLYYRGVTYPSFRNVVNREPLNPQPVFENDENRS